MEKKTPQDLIDHYLSGQATAQEKGILESWYLEHASKQVDVLPEPDYISLDKVLWPLIDQRTLSQKNYNKRWPVSLKLEKFGRTRVILKAAAAVFVMIGLSLYYLLPLNKSGPSNKIASDHSARHDIAPAKNTATLTLANGKTIQLNDTKAGVVIDARKFTYADGSPIALTLESDLASAKARTNIDISTPRGGTYQVVLPDGSQVWLNAASSIKFPLSFDGAVKRIVELSGEAYFKVRKSPDIPFIVKSRGQDALVLGTEFNINNYFDEEKVITTLVTGSLKVSTNKGKSALLIPGEETLLSADGLDKHAANVDMSIAWRKGVFYFNKTPFDVMMRQVSRWYNVDVVYTTKKIPDIHFSGEIKRDVMLQTVLTYIQDLGVRLRVEGRTLYIE